MLLPINSTCLVLEPASITAEINRELERGQKRQSCSFQVCWNKCRTTGELEKVNRKWLQTGYQWLVQALKAPTQRNILIWAYELLMLGLRTARVKKSFPRCLLELCCVPDFSSWELNAFPPWQLPSHFEERFLLCRAAHISNPHLCL